MLSTYVFTTNGRKYGAPRACFTKSLPLGGVGAQRAKLKLRCRSTSLYMRPEKTLGHVFQISISVLYSEPFHRPFQELCTTFTLMQKVTVWSVAYVFTDCLERCLRQC